MSPVERERDASARAAATLRVPTKGTSLSLVAGNTVIEIPPAMAHGVRRLLEAVLREAGRGRTVLVASIGEEEIGKAAAARILDTTTGHVADLIHRGILRTAAAGVPAKSQCGIRLADVLAYRLRLDARALSLAAVERLADEIDLEGLDGEI
jgi:hypothetical protein